jgi:K+:H+ antiporter
VHQLEILRDLVLIALVAVPVVLVTNRLRVPAVVGFLITGMAIGPHALRLIPDPASVATLAELGTVLLLFTVGLELSVSRVLKMGRDVVLGGGLQLTATVVAVALLAVAWGEAQRTAVLIGCLYALSSTAIVLKIYTDRQELDAPQGRASVALLLFQDLAVVPLMLLLPVLAGAASSPAGALRQFALSLAVVGAIVGGGLVAVPRVLDRVARLPTRELFTLCIVVFGLGAAYATAEFGLSLALGAFLAGLVISESEYGLQAMSDVLPFRDTFSGIFFTSIGMLLDPAVVAARPGIVLGGAALIIAIKVAIVTGVVVVLGYSARRGFVAGMGLAQVGEFSFVLAGAAVSLGLLPDQAYQAFLATAVLSMLATPALIATAGPIAGRAAQLLGGRARAPEGAEATPPGLANHVIIVGFGLNGRNLARVLRGAAIAYVILEENGRTVRRAREDGEPIVFGDGTRGEVLHRVGIERARAIVYVIASPEAARRGVATARALNPRVHIVVRTRYVAAIEDLQRLGADEVVPEEFETSLEIFARVLRNFGLPSSSIRAEVDAVRRDHYEMFRGRERPYAGHFTDLALSLGVRIGVETVKVDAGAAAIGANPRTLRLRQQTGATVVAVIRGKDIVYEPSPSFGFQDLDTVVIVGTPEALQKAMALFQAAP